MIIQILYVHILHKFLCLFIELLTLCVALMYASLCSLGEEEEQPEKTVAITGQ